MDPNLHVKQAVNHLERTPEAVADYRFADFTVENYNHHSALRAPIAV